MPAKKLHKYHARRDFNKTPEPAALKSKRAANSHLFVVQKHNASHLHYDLRLEVGGVLKSWAVPKGIPRAFGEKHLAIETEDHPLAYAAFEGKIPAGEYGAGTVKIWDTGKYELLHAGSTHKASMNGALKKGALKFKFYGKRYKGTYALARFQIENNKKQWLLFRIEDEA